MKRRIAITGLGLLSPVGISVCDSWKNILAGRSGISKITHFNTDGITSKISGAVPAFDLDKYIQPKEQKKMDPFIHYGIVAGIQAIEDSGLDMDREDLSKIGVAIGSGIGGISTIQATTERYLEHGPRRISPFFIPSSIINMVSGNLSIVYGLQGPNFSITTACTTGAHNIGDAARLIEYGDADIMVAGGVEMSSCPITLAGFAATRALSVRNDDPTAASRPWDKDRDGFVLSDGAGVVVLEEYEHAKKRGAKCYAEIVGYGMSGDAYHMTAPSETGDGAMHCMKNALKNAALNPNEVDYINAHGTSTPVGDIAEVQAIKQVFGSEAKNLVISSTKSMTGHLLGGAGGVEAIFSILAICDQVVPPTINLDSPDVECDLDFVPHHARDMKVDISLSNSFGFGGTNGTLIFKKI